MFFAKKHGTCHRAHSAFTHKANKRTLCSVSLKQNHTKSPDALRAVLPLVSGFKLGTGVQRLCRSRSLVAGLLFCHFHLEIVLRFHLDHCAAHCTVPMTAQHAFFCRFQKCVLCHIPHLSVRNAPVFPIFLQVVCRSYVLAVRDSPYILYHTLHIGQVAVCSKRIYNILHFSNSKNVFPQRCNARFCVQSFCGNTFYSFTSCLN